MGSVSPAISEFDAEAIARAGDTRALKARRRTRSAWFAAVLATLVTGSSAAQTPPASSLDATLAIVGLRMPTCADSRTISDRFAQLLAIELSGARLQLVKDAPTSSAELMIELDAAICEGPAREIGIAIVPLGGARAYSRIDLSDVEEGARARALALAVAEVVRAAHDKAPAARTTSAPSGESEGLLATGEVEQRQTREPVPQRVVVGALDSDARVRGVSVAPDTAGFSRDVEAAAKWRIFTAESTMMTGANVSMQFALRPDWLKLRAGGNAAWGDASDVLGDVRLGLYSASVSLLAATGRLPELEIGPELELGYLAAFPTSKLGSVARSEGRVAGLLSLTAGARFWFDHWALFLGIHAGAGLAGADIFADDRRIASVAGFFAGARAGLAFGF